MAGIFPASGVPASEAQNSAENPSVAPGCIPLYASNTRCQPRFDPASYNAIISELLNAITCLGGTYDCQRLDNLCTALLAKFGSIATRTRVIQSTENFTVPPGVTQLEVQVIGGGGGGGRSGDGTGGGIAGNVGGGGGGGGYAYALITGLTPGAIIPATVGVGGVSGFPGGASGFAGITALGGGAGPSGSLTLFEGGLGGTASGGDINIQGADGGRTGPNTSSTPTPSDILVIYGRGGVAAGGLSVPQFGGTGGPGRGRGTGGNGASGGNNIAGGAGGSGAIILRW